MAAVRVAHGVEMREFLFVADCENCRVVRWRAGAREGEVVAGGNGRGNRLDQLDIPTSIAVERDGAVLVAEGNNHRVVRWRAGARVGEVVAGGNGSGDRLDQLSRPWGIAVERDGAVKDTSE